LVDNLLEYTDRMSMAVGMEVRVPLLEPEVVAYALNVPFSWKLGARSSKIIERDAFQRFLTPEVRRGAKRGFNAPLGIWMRGPLAEYIVASQQDRHPLKDVLGADIGASWGDEGVLNWSYIDKLRRAHREGRHDLSYELFAVIAFDVWWRKYITGTLPIEHWSATPTGARSDREEWTSTASTADVA
jgi:asparagine synthase (glutamine-hydrolysing)